ncbi:MAG: uroporphyrinogen-III synthase [Parasphingorhabdus sp.]|uniref:uroporphyrinogen-III synthase n=1 Tax=Parasphingorhabdus sp. TaxID=2709688 RepID=UPI003003437E
MTLSVLILRPITGGQETARRAKDHGLHPIVDPLFVIEPMAWTAPPASDFDALMLTSANAVQYAGSVLGQYQHLPVLAVGEATAQAARNAGLDVIMSGNGGAEELLRSVATDRYPNILRLMGKDHIKLVQTEHSIKQCCVYQSRALPLGEMAQAALQQGHVVVLHSARAGKTVMEEMERLGLDRSINHIAALSPKIAKAAGTGWKSVQAAEQPTDDALLSLAGRLCLS